MVRSSTEICDLVNTRPLGPIVRINPDEIHILDPEFYEDIYTSAARPRDKSEWWLRAFGMSNTTVSSISADAHRMRRGILNPYFSKKAILEDALPIIKSKVAKLLDRFRRSVQNRDVVPADTAFMALTMDIISSYTQNMETNYLDEDDFHKIWQDCAHAGLQAMGVSRHFGWIPVVMSAIPVDTLIRLIPLLGHLQAHRENIKAGMERVWYEDEGKSRLRDADSMTRRSMVHSMRDANHLPASERDPERIVDELALILSAGSEPTARTLSVASYYLLTNRETLSTLRKEIIAIIPANASVSDIPYAALENLPYLSAVVSEAIRISHGLVSRLPRLIPQSSNEKLKYKEWVIPKGVAFSMSSYYVTTDPNIFPDPHSFRPERWLMPANGDKESGQQKFIFNTAMNKYLTTFSKGSRGCIGIGLAYVELYVTLATLAIDVLGPESEVGMELYDVDYDRDIKVRHDCLTGFPSLDSKGVRLRSAEKL